MPIPTEEVHTVTVVGHTVMEEVLIAMVHTATGMKSKTPI